MKYKDTKNNPYIQIYFSLQGRAHKTYPALHSPKLHIFFHITKSFFPQARRHKLLILKGLHPAYNPLWITPINHWLIVAYECGYRVNKVCKNIYRKILRFANESV
jgi:hypothetical protein